nr:hypothetical protein [uncultured Allomuricauda sp.]
MWNKKKEIIATQICGYGRYLYRNGKPEIFCISSTKKSLYKLKPRNIDRIYHKIEIEREEINGGVNRASVIDKLEELQKLIEKGTGKWALANGPLYWNILFAISYLKDTKNDKKLEKFFNFS